MSCIYYVLYQGNLSSIKLEKASVDCLVPPIMHMHAGAAIDFQEANFWLV